MAVYFCLIWFVFVVVVVIVLWSWDVVVVDGIICLLFNVLVTTLTQFIHSFTHSHIHFTHLLAGKNFHFFVFLLLLFPEPYCLWLDFVASCKSEKKGCCAKVYYTYICFNMTCIRGFSFKSYIKFKTKWKRKKLKQLCEQTKVALVSFVLHIALDIHFRFHFRVPIYNTKKKDII